MNPDIPVQLTFTSGCGACANAVSASTAQHSTAQHSTAQHSTAQHSTAQHSTAQHPPTLKLRRTSSTAQHPPTLKLRRTSSTASTYAKATEDKQQSDLLNCSAAGNTADAAKNVKKERQSNFELLRIICMIMIVAYHFGCYSGITADNSTIFNWIIVNLLCIGKVGVNCFVLISAWFLCGQTQFSWKKIVLFILQTTIYSAGLYTAFVSLQFIRSGTCNFDPILFSESFLPLIYTGWWFAKTYFPFLLLAPFLNKILYSIDRKTHEAMLAAAAVLWCVIPAVFNFCTVFLVGKGYDKNMTGFSNLLLFVVLFFIAAYIKKYPCNFFDSRKFSAVAFASFTLLFILTVVVSVFAGTKWPGLLKYANQFTRSEMHPVILGLSLSLFCLMKNMKPFSSKLVNILAAAMFGVYLIHEHYIIRIPLWQKVFAKTLTLPDSPFFIWYALGVIILVFAICTVLSLIYNFTVDICLKKLLNSWAAGIESLCGKVKKICIKVCRMLNENSRKIF